MHVKKGDTVLVIAGNDKGKTGEITSVLRQKGRVVVAGGGYGFTRHALVAPTPVPSADRRTTARLH